jgi:hypothetical protein
MVIFLKTSPSGVVCAKVTLQQIRAEGAAHITRVVVSQA